MFLTYLTLILEKKPSLPDCQLQLLIYVDGLAWHSEPRQRVHDNRITNRVQTLGYRVFRFLGTETNSHPERCVAQLIAARKTTS